MPLNDFNHVPRPRTLDAFVSFALLSLPTFSLLNASDDSHPPQANTSERGGRRYVRYSPIYS